MDLKNERRIPTVFAFFLLLALSAGALFVSDDMGRLLGRAKPSATTAPQDIRISNASSGSVTVTWLTSEPISATIKYGIDARNNTAYDVRDSDQIPKAYRFHYFELSGFSPQSTVSYEIVSGTASYPQENIVLGPQLSVPPQTIPVYGEITKTDNQPPTAIVLVRLDDSGWYSAFLNGQTSWSIPLSSMRTTNLQSYYCAVHPCSDETTMELLILSDFQTVQKISTLGSARPFEQIMLGDQVILSPSPTPTVTPAELTQLQTPTPEEPAPVVKGIETTREPSPRPSPSLVPTKVPTTTPTETPSPTSKPTSTPTPTKKPTQTPTPTKPKQKQGTVSILTPKENAVLSFPRPLIRGQGIAGEEIIITLESKVRQVGKAVVDENGTWLWTPGYPLEAGMHTVTVRTKDAQGIAVTMSRVFHILKSGEQVLAGSTPSATISPFLPTPTRIPPSLPVPSPTSTVPVPGGFIPSILFVGGGASLLLLSLVLL